MATYTHSIQTTLTSVNINVKSSQVVQLNNLFCLSLIAVRYFSKCFGVSNKILSKELIALFDFRSQKNYYRLARVYHPDRAPAAEKLEANEKFSILHQAYVILSDPDKKKQYDTGSIVLFSKPTISAQWEHFIEPVTENALDIARKRYQNTCKEESDIIREFNKGKGSMTHMLNNLPFMRIEDETRIIAIIMRMVDMGRVEKFRIKKIPKH